MLALLKAKIAGFGCMHAAVDYLPCRLWPQQAQSEISKPNPCRARNRTDRFRWNGQFSFWAMTAFGREADQPMAGAFVVRSFPTGISLEMPDPSVPQQNHAE
jgi:hypothetical protein